MAKNQYEQDMINNLDSNFTRIKLVYKNVQTNPDVAFDGQIGTNRFYFILEAKKHNASNPSNYPIQLLAEILVNRKHYFDGKIKNPSNFPETYGIILAYDNQKTDPIYDFLVNHTIVQDWIDFGAKFNCEYVFLYDETNTTLDYQKWDTFLTALNPTLF